MLEAAIAKAEKFLWNEQDQATGLWPSTEAAPAIISLAASRQGVDGGRFTKDPSANDVVSLMRNVKMVHLEFLKELAEAGNDITQVEDRVLTELLGVIRLTCSDDPRNFYGYNLLQVHRFSVLIASVYLT